MVRTMIAAMVAWGICFGTVEVHAAPVVIGTAEGEIIVQYHGSRAPENIAYIKHGQNVFNFNPALNSVAPGYGATHFWQAVQDQFELHLLFKGPEWESLMATDIVALHANQANTVETTHAVVVDWAITDPNTTNANSGRTGNSPFRGGDGDSSSIAWTQTYTPTPSGGTIAFDGVLDTDGLIHWFSAAGANADGTSNMTSGVWEQLFPTSQFLFSGSFDFESTSTIEGNVRDVFYGTAQLTAIPLPAAAWAGLALMGGLVARKIRAWRRAD